MEIRLIAEGDWKATLRKQWDKAVRNELEEPDGYTRVAVLIIRWDDSLDTDLKTKGEVCCIGFV